MGTFLLLFSFLVEAAVGYYFVTNASTFIAAQAFSHDTPAVRPARNMKAMKKIQNTIFDNITPEVIRQILLDSLKSILMLALSTGIAVLFDRLHFSEANIIMVYILGTVLTSTITSTPVYGVISSIISVILFNYLFTDPRYTLFVYETGYQSTFLIMFFVAVMIGSLNRRLKKAAQQQAEAELKIKSEQMRANLLRAISHDLRTPLTAISGHASNLLKNEDLFDKKTRDLLYQDISDDSSYLIDLVENLLSVSRITEGEMHLRKETESLEDILTEAMRHVNRKASEHTLRLNMPDDMILVNVDSRLIIQVIINLINNAISYTQKNSVIEVAAEHVGSNVLISVKDNGPGIPDDEKEKIFDLFYSGNNERGDGVRSTGIGLSVCKSIIQAHQGTIEVKDNQPTGSVFLITLPAVEVSLYE